MMGTRIPVQVNETRWLMQWLIDYSPSQWGLQRVDLTDLDVVDFIMGMPSRMYCASCHPPAIDTVLLNQMQLLLTRFIAEPQAFRDKLALYGVVPVVRPQYLTASVYHACMNGFAQGSLRDLPSPDVPLPQLQFNSRLHITAQWQAQIILLAKAQAKQVMASDTGLLEQCVMDHDELLAKWTYCGYTPLTLWQHSITQLAVQLLVCVCVTKDDVGYFALHFSTGSGRERRARFQSEELPPVLALAHAIQALPSAFEDKQQVLSQFTRLLGRTLQCPAPVIIALWEFVVALHCQKSHHTVGYYTE